MGLKRCDFGFQTSINNASNGAYFCSQYIEWTHVMLNLFYQADSIALNLNSMFQQKKYMTMNMHPIRELSRGGNYRFTFPHFICFRSASLTLGQSHT